MNVQSEELVIQTASLEGYLELARKMTKKVTKGGKSTANKITDSETRATSQIKLSPKKVNELLQQNNIHPDQAKSGQGQFAVLSLVNLLEQTAKKTNDPAFGLRLGSQQSFQAVGELGILLQSCKTIREAIDLSSAFGAYHNQEEYWALEESNKFALLKRYDLLNYEGESRQLKELAIAVCLKLFKTIFSDQPTLIAQHFRVQFSHHPLADLSEYKQLLGVPVEFNAEDDVIIFPKQFLSKRVERIQIERAQDISEKISTMEKNKPNPYSKSVVKVIERMLGWENSSVEIAAHLLGLNLRTLQRHLKQEGTSFKKLLLETRIITAKKYLKMSRVDITLLATRLGYKEVANFSRVFKKETGLTPREWRQAHES